MWGYLCGGVSSESEFKHVPFCRRRWCTGTTFKFLHNYLPSLVVIFHLRVSIYKLISAIVRSLIILLIQTLIILMAVNNGMWEFNFEPWTQPLMEYIRRYRLKWKVHQSKDSSPLECFLKLALRDFIYFLFPSGAHFSRLIIKEHRSQI